MLYRVRRKLTISRTGEVVPANSISDLAGMTEGGKQILLKARKIVEISAPPLAILPGWSYRARQLRAKLGIEDAAQFLEISDDVVMEKVGVRRATVEKWKEDVRQYLVAASPTRG